MAKTNGPRSIGALGVAVALIGMAVFVAVRYWWVLVLAGGALLLAAALGWIALNAERLSKKDAERLLRRLRGVLSA